MASVELHRETNDGQSVVSETLLWISVLGGPLTFLLNLQVSYMMVDWACGTANEWTVHVTHAVALAIVAACAALGFALWKRVRERPADAGATSTARSQFLAILGALGGVLFGISIVAQWIPVMVLGTCLRS